MEELNIEEIQKIIPQRYPFLFIDRVIEVIAGKKIVAIKNVTNTEGYLPGHFPQQPIMPGTLIVESMAQASTLLYHSAYKNELKSAPSYYLGSIKASFKDKVVPGDQLKIVAETVKLIPSSGLVTVKAFVKDKLVAEAELVFAVKRDNESR